MTTQNKWNIELLYAVIFFIAANAIFWYDLLWQTSSYVLSSSYIYTHHTFLEIFRFTLLTVTKIDFTNTLSFIFILLSIYCGIKSLKKACVCGERKKFGFIPKNILGYLATAMISISSIFIILFLIAFCYSFFPTQSLAHQKCPEEYASTDAGDTERLASMNKWTNDFYDVHPGSTLSQWAEARHQFYIENNCTVTLQKYDAVKNSTVDTATIQRVQDGIQEALNNNAN